jgi:hypothetical protein
MVCAQVIKVFRTVRDVRHKLQEDVSVSSVLADLSIRGPRVHPIEHVFRGHEEIERHIKIVRRASQSVQIAAQLAEEVLRGYQSKYAGHLGYLFVRLTIALTRRC